MSSFEPKQFGRYYLLEKLATGGMAEIFKAKTSGAGGFEKFVAVKRLLPQCSADKEFISMMIDEARLTVTLTHANIVQVYDFDKVGDDYFISMEFINGINLKDIICRCQQNSIKIPEDIATYIASEVCKGLDYAHGKKDSHGKPLGIVHRDISPQNILISYEGEVKIVDFGIAKAAMNISHTMTGILKGKIAYMSPEQAVGTGIDYRSDIFSTGVVLYETLMGEKLFSGESQLEVLNKIRVAHIDTEKLPKTVSSEIRKILTRALARDAKKRFFSAGEMQAALTKYLYSTYPDFMPQQLTNFIKRLYADGISKPGDGDMIATGILPSIDIHPAGRKHSNLLRKIEAAAAILIAIGGVALAYYNFVHLKPKAAPPAVPDIASKIPAPAVEIKSVPAIIEEKPLEKPVPEIGSIRVSSTPSGAKIFHNGRDTGLVTPATIRNVPVGKRQAIRMSKDGFEVATRSVTLRDAFPSSLNATLKPTPPPSELATPVPPTVAELAPPPKVAETTPPPEPAVADGTKLASLRISSDPAGADVFVDAEFKGTTPVAINNVNPGTVNLVVNKEGKIKHVQKISLKAGEKKDLGTIKLGEIYGTVSVASTPPTAAIIFDGENIGVKTPVTIKNVRRDKQHTIRLTLQGYKSWEKSFSMRDVEDKKFNIMLEE